MKRLIAVLVAAAFGATSMAAVAQTTPATKSEKAAKAAEQEKRMQEESYSSAKGGPATVDKTQPKRTKAQKREQARQAEKSYQAESANSTASPKVDKSAPKALPDRAAKQEAVKGATQNKDNKP